MGSPAAASSGCAGRLLSSVLTSEGSTGVSLSTLGASFAFPGVDAGSSLGSVTAGRLSWTSGTPAESGSPLEDAEGPAEGPNFSPRAPRTSATKTTAVARLLRFVRERPDAGTLPPKTRVVVRSPCPSGSFPRSASRALSMDWKRSSRSLLRQRAIIRSSHSVLRAMGLTSVRGGGASRRWAVRICMGSPRKGASPASMVKSKIPSE